MLDNFKKDQFIPYTIITNAIKNNKLSHAYLIDGNNYEYAFDFVMSFVKTIVCENNFTYDSDKCSLCNICMRIDDGNYPEVKIIESDNMVIKKEQLLDLQSSFSRSGLEGNKRIYIIKDCEKMNKQAANSLLKFLEEPVENVVAVLFSNNISSILSTIISRCQFIKLNNIKHVNANNTIENFAFSVCNNKSDIDNFLNDESKNKIISDVVSFIDYFEKNDLDVFIFLKKMWFNNFLSRDDNLLAILLITYFYYDVLKYKYNINDFYFVEFDYLIKEVANNNSILTILNKIELCYNKYDDLKYNLNLNLFIDDFLIRLGECYECC